MVTIYIIAGLAGIAVVWAVVSYVLLTAELHKRGVKIPVHTYRWMVLNYLEQYKNMTVAETGKIGNLFFSYTIPINLAWILSLAALIAWYLSR